MTIKKIQRFNEDGERIVFSHGSWMTEKEDARICDMVDSIIQDNDSNN